MAQQRKIEPFSDRRVFLIQQPGTSEVVFTQADDGPTLIRIGTECTDEYLTGLWRERKRFPSLELEQLLAARAGQSIQIQ